jgi:DNA-binding beta-propeller fold protein YncE
MVISDDGKQLNDIGLEGKPWGIVVVPDKEEAIVTLHNKNFIQIINIRYHHYVGAPHIT